MAILRRLFLVIAVLFFIAPSLRAQAVTVVDGSQANIPLMQSGSSYSGWYTWKAKYIPSHIVISYEPVGGGVTIIGNPVVECTLDDQSQNPNDASRWTQVAISVPNSDTADALSPQVGTGTGVNTPQLVQTGVMPCVSWAIKTNGISTSGGLKIMAVQLPASGDAAWLFSISSNSGNTSGIQGGAVRVNTQTPCSGGGCPAPSSVLQGNPIQVQAPAGNTTPIPTTPGGTQTVSLAVTTLFTNNSGISPTSTQTLTLGSNTNTHTYGLFVAFTGITGSPAGCTIQQTDTPSFGGVANANDGTATAIAITTGSSSFIIKGTLSSNKTNWVYNCTTFPTAGNFLYELMGYQNQ